MPPFYRSAWFPYVVPFLTFLTLVQVELYLPQWHGHTYSARVLLCGGLLWMWRNRFRKDTESRMTGSQTALAVTTGIGAFCLWPLALHLGIISWTSQPTNYPMALQVVLAVFKIIGFVVVFPIMHELFWRSFMLRYFINADFRAIKLGTFQLFSVVGVTVLSGLAVQYGTVQATISLLLSLLLIWQKNLRCCIVAHSVCQALLCGYLLFNHLAFF